MSCSPSSGGDGLQWIGDKAQIFNEHPVYSLWNLFEQLCSWFNLKSGQTDKNTQQFRLCLHCLNYLFKQRKTQFFLQRNKQIDRYKKLMDGWIERHGGGDRGENPKRNMFGRHRWRTYYNRNMSSATCPPWRYDIIKTSLPANDTLLVFTSGDYSFSFPFLFIISSWIFFLTWRSSSDYLIRPYILSF